MFDIEALIENVPWWVKWLLLVGGGLMSAFASKLPDSIQTLGLEIGIICAVLGSIGFIWHFINEWRARNKKPRLKVEPLHLVILGLLLALGGAIWLWISTPAVGTPEKVTTNTNVSAGPANPTASKPIPGQKTSTHLTLQFGHGTTPPIASDLENIWRWYALANVVVFISKEDGSKHEIKTWTVFLTLDRPINLRQVIVTSSSPLPTYEVKDRDSRSVVVAFSGDVIDLSVNIEAVGEVIDASPSATATIGSPPPQKISKNYFPAEKIELGNLLSTISDRLNSDGLDSAIAGSRLGNFGVQSKESATDTLQRIRDVQQLTIKMSRGIWDEVVQKNPRFTTELTEIVGQNSGNTPLSDFQKSLNVFERDIDIYLRQFDSLGQENRSWMTEFFQRDTQAVADTAGRFQGWLQDCNRKIDDYRELLR